MIEIIHYKDKMGRTEQSEKSNVEKQRSRAWLPVLVGDAASGYLQGKVLT